MSTGGTTNNPSKSLIMRGFVFIHPYGVPNSVPSLKKVRLKTFLI